ncbi:MAG: hypothetical protein AAF989_09485, partial [Planctomycetota bacterium]
IGFTIERLARAAQFVGKGIGATELKLGQLVQEQAKLNGFVKSKQVKRLDDVNAAKTRLKAIGKLISSVQLQLGRQMDQRTQLLFFQSTAEKMDVKSGLRLMVIKK